MNNVQKQTLEILQNLTSKQVKKIEELENNITDLENKLKDEECKLTDEIDCGIGKIEFFVIGSIQLQQLMESLERAIKKHDTIYIEQVLDLIANQ